MYFRQDSVSLDNNLIIFFCFTATNEFEFVPAPNVQCACSGDVLTYTCTNVGDGITLWEGTAFQCPANGIVLRHNLFMNGITQTCNDGNIIGQSVQVDNNRYTSQLKVTVTSNFILNNKWISCLHNSINVTGNSTLMILQGI